MERETTYVALIRGLNVGRSARVAMAPLRTALQDHGVQATATVLQSGNVIVEQWTKGASELARRVEQVLRDSFAINVSCLVRSKSELLRLVGNNPLARRATSDTLLVVHLCEPRLASSAIGALTVKGLSPDDVAVCEGSLFQWCEKGISNSPVVSPQLERQLSVIVTARNWRTLTTIAELFSGE